MTVCDGDGAGVDGAGGAGEDGPGDAGGDDSGAGVSVLVTVRGVSGAGVAEPSGGSAVVGLSDGLFGTPGEFDGSGECGTVVVRGADIGGGGGGRQTGSTEPWASLLI